MIGAHAMDSGSVVLLVKRTPPTHRQVKAGPLAAERMLTRALTEAKVPNPYRVLFARYPTMRSIALRLAWYLTDELPVPINFQRSLLAFCLKRGNDYIQEHERMLPDAPPDQALFALAAGMFRPIAMLAELEVSCGERIWDPFADGPLGDFQARYGKPSYRLVEPSDAYLEIAPATMRLHVAEQVMTASDIEQVGGTLDAIGRYEAAA